MPRETVLVTGAGGFIGSSLVDDQLSKGRRVIALDMNLDRLQHLENNDACELVVGDIRNAGLVNDLVGRSNVVFHLASAHLEVSKSDSYFWETNVDALKKLLQSASDSGVHRFVHCSTVGVYGPLHHLPASEQTPCEPDIVYEQTKLAGEDAVREHVKTTGLSAVILRPAWVYGPRCPRTLKLFRTIRKRRFFMVGEGKNMRHPIYITDMLQAFELAAQKNGVDGQTFLIAGSEPVELRSLIQTIIKVQALNFNPVTVPFLVMTPMCVAVETAFKMLRKEPPFSTRSLKFFTESSSFDISKAREKLGFEPNVSLAEGLTMTYEYYKKNNIM